MTVGLIALFASLAACALIGWGFVRVMGLIARSLQRLPQPPARRASNPTVVLRGSTTQELAEKVEGNGAAKLERPVETYFEKGRWKNKVHGNSRASNVHATSAAAVTAGREMARRRKVEHLIKNESGTVQERINYGSGPLVPG